MSIPLTILWCARRTPLQSLVCETHTAPVKKAPDRNQVLFVCDIAIDYLFALAFALVFAFAGLFAAFAAFDIALAAVLAAV